MRDGLPQLPGSVADEINIYTGGPVLEAVYWAKDTPTNVVGFFQREMSLLGWQAQGSVSVAPPQPNAKDAGTTGLSLTFVKHSFRVTVGVGENIAKDAARGTTRIGILIERP